MKNMKRIILAFMLFLMLPVWALASAFSKEIAVAAAANVQYTLEELKAEFEKLTDIKLKTIIGSSGKLTAQIENGAPFDIFISADMEYPQALNKEGLTRQPPKVYAYGTLVIWTFKYLDLSKGLAVLADPSVKRIAIANPKTAPYGRQAVNAIKHDNLYKEIDRKLVYGESIAQVNQFITTGAVDLGFTAKSVVLDPNLKEKGKWVEVDPNFYSPVAQGVVILKHAEKNNVLKETQSFYDFLFSSTAQDIFKKYGYKLP